jgi:CDGSH-type Zn-finger protein
MSDAAIIAQKAPFAVALEAGKAYFWCACGRSKSQPFCDGSHKGTSFVPTKVTVEESKTAYLCGCKHSKNGAFCDGTHKSI